MVSYVKIALNTIRVLSIITCLFVLTTSVIVNVQHWLMIGKAGTLFQFIDRAFVSLVVFVLVLVEVEWPRWIFRLCPLYNDSHSWVPLGMTLICIGTFILGYDSLIIDSDTPDQALYFCVLVPGWLAFLLGCIYLLLGIGGPSLRAKRSIKGRFCFGDSRC
ncbi:uncharacterized protein BJ171DRAFT_580596 [Polychytrium aggregatum]|uniref:uncharacterized protein n=1 Tax=Polychytrium aggregatum TaxID=110093 RepID=UPI0022FEC5DC|nr:uncharacterized protein BJ171DRAFT_580596 [Polychytrium aggregatum]KAI9205951.1 hypothetical protein BJ171DRAFT_580596 [Polychytrium aggregatum]